MTRTAARPQLALPADLLTRALLAIAVITLLSGVGQLLAPGTVLELLGAESTAAARHGFATVGMFMVVVGGLLATALLTPAPPGYVLTWSALQKAGAAVAVTWGVASGVFGALALAVAVFDAGTAAALFVLRARRGR